MIKQLVNWVFDLVYPPKITEVKVGELYRYNVTNKWKDTLEVIAVHADGTFDAIYVQLNAHRYKAGDAGCVKTRNMTVKFLNNVGAYVISQEDFDNDA